MPNKLHFYTYFSKEKIKLTGKYFASGGEGALYKIASPKDYQHLVAKIYLPNKRTSIRETKMKYLIENPPVSRKELHNLGAAWVIDLLYQKDKFVGIIMPLAKGIKLTTLCIPKLPRRIDKAWQRFAFGQESALKLRLKTCFNLAIALQTIHHSNRYVLVDLKPDNILMQANGLVCLVDIDSVEVVEDGKLIFSAPVATPEYTPPEHYKVKRSIIEPSWDYFSLGVIFYQLLLGLHPFAASAHPPYDKLVGLHDKIEHGLYVHHSEQQEVFQVIPPPHRQFKRLPVAIQALFNRCFEEGAITPALRPMAMEWCETLAKILKIDSSVIPKIQRNLFTTSLDALPKLTAYTFKPELIKPAVKLAKQPKLKLLIPILREEIERAELKYIEEMYQIHIKAQKQAQPQVIYTPPSSSNENKKNTTGINLASWALSSFILILILLITEFTGSILVYPFIYLIIRKALISITSEPEEINVIQHSYTLNNPTEDIQYFDAQKLTKSIHGRLYINLEKSIQKLHNEVTALLAHQAKKDLDEQKEMATKVAQEYRNQALHLKQQIDIYKQENDKLPRLKKATNKQLQALQEAEKKQLNERFQTFKTTHNLPKLSMNNYAEWVRSTTTQMQQARQKLKRLMAPLSNKIEQEFAEQRQVALKKYQQQIKHFQTQQNKTLEQLTAVTEQAHQDLENYNQHNSIQALQKKRRIHASKLENTYLDYFVFSEAQQIKASIQQKFTQQQVLWHQTINDLESLDTITPEQWHLLKQAVETPFDFVNTTSNNASHQQQLKQLKAKAAELSKKLDDITKSFELLKHPDRKYYFYQHHTKSTINNLTTSLELFHDFLAQFTNLNHRIATSISNKRTLPKFIFKAFQQQYAALPPERQEVIETIVNEVAAKKKVSLQSLFKTYHLFQGRIQTLKNQIDQQQDQLSSASLDIYNNYLNGFSEEPILEIDDKFKVAITALFDKDNTNNQKLIDGLIEEYEQSNRYLKPKFDNLKKKWINKLKDNLHQLQTTQKNATTESNKTSKLIASLKRKVATLYQQLAIMTAIEEQFFDHQVDDKHSALLSNIYEAAEFADKQRQLDQFLQNQELILSFFQSIFNQDLLSTIDEKINIQLPPIQPQIKVIKKQLRQNYQQKKKELHQLKIQQIKALNQYKDNCDKQYRADIATINTNFKKTITEQQETRIKERIPLFVQLDSVSQALNAWNHFVEASIIPIKTDFKQQYQALYEKQELAIHKGITEQEKIVLKVQKKQQSLYLQYEALIEDMRQNIDFYERSSKVYRNKITQLYKLETLDKWIKEKEAEQQKIALPVKEKIVHKR